VGAGRAFLKRTMDPDIAIRLFLPDDFSAVCDLEQGEKGSPYSAAVFVRQASVLFCRTFLVAVCKGTVVGYTIGAAAQAAPGDGWVLRLRVADRYHRRSIGKALLTSLLTAFAFLQVRRVLLTVAPENHPARALYHSVGFEETGFLPGYFGKGEDRLVLSADLPHRNDD
jgi:ribosomal-protein-alanine N-acetyltransferase